MVTRLRNYQSKILGYIILIIIFSMAFISCGTQKKAQDQSQEITVTSEENAQTTEEVAPTDQKESEYKVHVVRKGETLSIIAGRYKVTVEAIVKLNKIKDANLITVGQKLLIPEPEEFLK